MKYATLFSLLAMASLPAWSDELPATGTPETETIAMQRIDTPIYNAADSEFGNSELSNKETIMKNKTADGRRLEK